MPAKVPAVGLDTSRQTDRRSTLVAFAQLQQHTRPSPRVSTHTHTHSAAFACWLAICRTQLQLVVCSPNTGKRINLGEPVSNVGGMLTRPGLTTTRVGGNQPALKAAACEKMNTTRKGEARKGEKENGQRTNETEKNRPASFGKRRAWLS